MKNLIPIVLLCLFAGFGKAQEVETDLPAVGVTPFYSDGDDQLELSQELYEAVTRRLIQSKRFRVIDIPKRQNAKEELQTMKRRDFIQREIVEAGKSTPAEYLLVGFIRNTELFSIDSLHSEVRVDFEVKYIDVKTGEAIDAQTFTGTSWSKPEIGKDIGKKLLGGKKGDAVGAFAQVDDMLSSSIKGKIIDAVDNSADQLFKWVLNTSKSNLYFLKVISEDLEPKKVENLLIEGGRDVGLEKDLKLVMVVDEELTGPRGNKVINEKPIARLKISDVRSQTSACKVTEKETDILPYLKEKKLRIIFDID